MTEFAVRCDINKLEQLLKETVGPRTYWIHNTIGGPGWAVYDIHQRVKTVSVVDEHLATFVRLKIQ